MNIHIIDEVNVIQTRKESLRAAEGQKRAHI